MSSKKKVVAAAVAALKSTELPGMPEPDAVGRLGQNFLACLEKFEGAKEDMEDRRAELAEAMKKYKRVSLKINGRQILLKHKEESDSITVKPLGK